MTDMPPIFIHSLFRAGSTYLFNCFRRSPAGYYCYQEPLNEFLLTAAEQPERLLEVHEGTARHLRHPALGQPYFQEFFPLAEQVGRDFRPSFPYADYFDNSPAATASLCRYLTSLATGARGRPVFQECRSCGRVAGIRECLGGNHLFLWRNPWDQWWSYKVDSYFDTCNLQILASPAAPSLFVAVRDLLDFHPRGSDVADLSAQRLDAAGSYLLFFALWCHAMLETAPRCDVDINIDSLSGKADYRADVLARLAGHGIDGIDVADCSIPIGCYGRDDRAFFREQERRVLELLPCHGYGEAQVERMQRLRADHDCHGADAGIPIVARQFDRLRETARRLESELGIAHRELGRARGTLDSTLADRRLVEEALRAKEAERAEMEAKLWAKEAERAEVEAKLWAKEAERAEVEVKLWAKEAERAEVEERLRAAAAECLALQSQLDSEGKARHRAEMALAAITNSRYWRWGRPIRAMAGLTLELFQRKRG